MNTKGYGNIPSELYYYITFLARTLPPRSIKTFIELLIGSLLTQSGFVTSSWWILDMKNQWFSYHKWLEKGKWSYLKITKRWTQLFYSYFQISRFIWLLMIPLFCGILKKPQRVRYIINMVVKPIYPNLYGAMLGGFSCCG